MNTSKKFKKLWIQCSNQCLGLVASLVGGERFEDYLDSIMIKEVLKWKHRLMWFHSTIVKNCLCSTLQLVQYMQWKNLVVNLHMSFHIIYPILFLFTNASLSLYPLFNFIKRDNLRKTNETKHILHLSMVRTSPSVVIKRTQVADLQL
jgi:hypothetical protein